MVSVRNCRDGGRKDLSEEISVGMSMSVNRSRTRLERQKPGQRELVGKRLWGRTGMGVIEESHRSHGS